MSYFKSQKSTGFAMAAIASFMITANAQATQTFVPHSDRTSFAGEPTAVSEIDFRGSYYRPETPIDRVAIANSVTQAPRIAAVTHVAAPWYRVTN